MTFTENMTKQLGLTSLNDAFAMEISALVISDCVTDEQMLAQIRELVAVRERLKSDTSIPWDVKKASAKAGGTKENSSS